MKTKTPTVSIGMPVRNGMPFLSEAIDSLLSQTYSDFELIISDNASDDGTAELCDEYARSDSRIRVLRFSENVGAAENYNCVFRESQGRFFKWAANDDICRPTYLERCVEILQSREDVVLCYPKTEFIDENGEWVTDYEDKMHLDYSSVSRRFRQVVYVLNRANCIFGLIRADALRRTNLIGAYRASDYVLCAELAMLGRYYEVPERLFLRRIHQRQSKEGKTTREIALWFQPRNAGGQVFPMWRLLRENILAILRSPIGFALRFGCILQLIFWLRRFRGALQREFGYGCRLLPRYFKSWIRPASAKTLTSK